METTTRRTGGTRLLQLSGRLTADRHDERLPDMVRRLVGEGTRRLVLDLRYVTYMDSTCLGELLEACHRAERQGAELCLINVPPRVQRLLDLSRLATLLSVRTRQDADDRAGGSAA